MLGQLAFDELVPLARGKDVPCPLCAGRIGDPKKAVLRVWLDGDFASYYCARCDSRGWARPEGAARSDKAELLQRMRKAEQARMSEMEKRIAKARWIWDQGRPAFKTIVSTYLLSRGIKRCPDTLRFLPARGNHAPAMLAAFGMPSEPLPGSYVLGSAGVQGIHITRLQPDGSGKAPDVEGKAKIMVGPSMGWPIALAPVNDQGGLLVAEGIETALSFAHTRLGIWAAGSAGRLPALAKCIADRSYVESVVIAADEDSHDEGRRCAEELADRLSVSRPDIETMIVGAS
jgi:hypothetical protein